MMQSRKFNKKFTSGSRRETWLLLTLPTKVRSKIGQDFRFLPNPRSAWRNEDFPELNEDHMLRGHRVLTACVHNLNREGRKGRKGCKVDALRSSRFAFCYSP
jgi:hypothetical protein